jgi:hypothetical protein
MDQIETKIFKPAKSAQSSLLPISTSPVESPESKSKPESESEKKPKRKAKKAATTDGNGDVDVDTVPNKLYGKISGLYVGGMKQTDLKISEDKDIILGTYPMVSEGFDCPTLDTVILASPKSDVVQSVGRIMRKKPEDRDRQHQVIDIIDYFSSFAQQWETRKRYYRKQKYQFDEYTYDDNSNETVISKKVPRKPKSLKEEMAELSFMDEDNTENHSTQSTDSKQTLTLDGFLESS